MQRTIILIVIGVLSMVALAGDAVNGERPRSAQAIEARSKYDVAQRKAKEAYQQAVKVAGNQYAADLQKALAMAVSKGDADEIVRIKGEVERVKVEGELAGGKKFTIYANKDWQPTIEVKKGQTVRIEATGKWKAGPGTPVAFGPDGITWEGKKSFYLEGKDGGKVFIVGEDLEYTSESDGMIYLRMHDQIFSDNSGAVTVSVGDAN
jgi:hypothetical protein